MAEKETVVGPLEGTLLTSDEVLKQANPFFAFWWFQSGLLWNCCGKSLLHSARGMSVMGLWIVVTIVGYDVVTQDFLFGSQVTDLYVVVAFIAFSHYIEKTTENAYRYGFIIVDPQVHHVVFLFWLLSIVLGVGLAVVAGSPGAIALAAGAVNPYPGTTLHQAIYVIVLVLLFLIVIHGLWWSFALFSYWGMQTTNERFAAFKAYIRYYHGNHVHLGKGAVTVPAGYRIGVDTAFSPPLTSSAAFPTGSMASPLLMAGGNFGQPTMVDMATLQKAAQTQHLLQENSKMQHMLTQRNPTPARSNPNVTPSSAQQQVQYES